MPNVVYEAASGTLAVVALPAGRTALEMYEADLLPIPDGAPWLEIPDTHPAAGPTADRLSVDWEAATVTVVPPPTPTPDELHDYANGRRQAVAYGGAPVGGMVVDSSADGVAMLSGVVQAFERGYITKPVDFKAASGWVSMTAAMATAAVAGVAQHVQAAFAVQRAIDAAIDAGIITTLAAIDDPASVGVIPWPPNT